MLAREGVGDGARTVGRPIVDDEHFHFGERQQGGDQQRKILALVVRGHQDESLHAVTFSGGPRSGVPKSARR